MQAWRIKLDPNNLVVIKTNNPTEAIWSELLMLSDFKYLEKILPGKSKSDYLYISTSIVQAREYYLASKSVSFKTKPLLIYYAFANLTKAFLYFKNDKIDDYHGLSKPEVGSSLLEFSVKINHGIFHSLSKYEQADFDVGRQVKLEEFIRNCIELEEHYFKYYEKPRWFVSSAAYAISNGTLIFRFPDCTGEKYKELESGIINYSSILDDFILSEEVGVLKLEIKRERLANEHFFSPETLKTFLQNIIERHGLYSSLDNSKIYFNLNQKEFVFPQTTSYYGVMFIMGTIVRYAPQLLYDILDNSETSVRWFFQKLCDISERVYPNLILNNFYKKTFYFVSN